MFLVVLRSNKRVIKRKNQRSIDNKRRGKKEKKGLDITLVILFFILLELDH
jgi:hypothetical protein